MNIEETLSALVREAQRPVLDRLDALAARLDALVAHPEAAAGAPPPRPMSLKDVCQETGFSENTVTKWLRAGTLTADKWPGSREWRIRRADFDAFMRSRSEPGAALAAEPAQPEQLRRVLASIGEKVKARGH